jgi:hypothetical protein
VQPHEGFRQWKWHLDEVYVKIKGEMHYLWRAVDQEGEVLESYVTKTRDKAAALSRVVEGPPGTGKSQTITNIIVAAAARGADCGGALPHRCLVGRGGELQSGRLIG